MIDIEKPESPTLAMQVHDHETRIKLLERDYAEIKELRTDVKHLQLDLSAVKIGIIALPDQLKSTVRAEIQRHEGVEAAAQNRLIWRVLGITLSVIGAALYVVFQHVVTKVL